MKNKDRLSDETLVSLHRLKRLNAFFILYGRYKNYGYAIIYRTLARCKLVNALKDEKDAIIYDSIMEAIRCFDKDRGNFRQLLSAIVKHQTLNYVKEFKKDPISDYISLDANLMEGSNLRFMDSLTFADKEASPQTIINLDEHTKKVVTNYQGSYKRRLKKMMELKEAGYSYQEIARKFHTSSGAVRAVFYRIKRQMDTKDSNKIKK